MDQLPILELLNNTKFTKRGAVDLDAIDHSSVFDILDFVSETIDLTDAEELAPERSVFSHSASTTLGGGRYPCSALKCRMDRVKELGQFAALYSERVYIKNFFSDHLEHVTEVDSINESELKSIFADDLHVFLTLVPLIESKIVIPITPQNYCAHCLLGRGFRGDAEKKLDHAFRRLRNEFERGLTVELRKDEWGYAYDLEGAPDLLEHGSMTITCSDTPSFLNEHPRLKSQVERGIAIKLSANSLSKSEVGKRLASDVMESVVFELATSQCLKTSFLTNRNLDVEFLKDISWNKAAQNADRLIQGNLTALVPFLDSVSTEDLVCLREADEESFLVFRSALKKAVKEQLADGNVPPRQRDANAIYGDIIQPELAKIEKKLRNAQKTLARHTVNTVAGWTGAISIGVFAGFLTGDVKDAATALGLVKVLATLMQKVGMDSDAEASVREDDFYFLWKVQQAV
jgi:hypothetical protein